MSFLILFIPFCGFRTLGGGSMLKSCKHIILSGLLTYLTEKSHFDSWYRIKVIIDQETRYFKEISYLCSELIQKDMNLRDIKKGL